MEAAKFHQNSSTSEGSWLRSTSEEILPSHWQLKQFFQTCPVPGAGSSLVGCLVFLQEHPGQISKMQEGSMVGRKKLASPNLACRPPKSSSRFYCERRHDMHPPRHHCYQLRASVRLSVHTRQVILVANRVNGGDCSRSMDRQKMLMNWVYQEILP